MAAISELILLGAVLVVGKHSAVGPHLSKSVSRNAIPRDSLDEARPQVDCSYRFQSEFLAGEAECTVHAEGQPIRWTLEDQLLATFGIAEVLQAGNQVPWQRYKEDLVRLSSWN